MNHITLLKTRNNFSKYYNKLTEIKKKNSPIGLFYSEDFSHLVSGRKVSVVGSRKVSKLVINRVSFITDFLVDNEITIVSALAK